MSLHAFNLRILAEDLVRVRRPDDRERYSASQRQARIDPNPHQIDAVIFALRRLREGGCILADEVGLGKTIEAGLVIAQSRAEGARRVLLIVPKSLIGQWQNELLNLFDIQAREDQTNFLAPGVYLVGREFAGSERGSAQLGASLPFDLVVIDEAHEIFAGLHKRYERDGTYDETSDEAMMAHRVRGFLRTDARAAADRHADAELAGGAMGPGAVCRANGDAARRHRDVPKGLLRRGRSNLGSRPGARVATASRDGSATDVAPPGAGVSRPAFHATALPIVRVRDERR